MMASYLANLNHSKRSAYRCLYLLRRTFSSNSANDSSPFNIETTLPFTEYKCTAPSQSVETSPAELMSFYKDMSIMRRMEITADSLYKSRLVHGFCHLYDGQEAVSIGIKAATTDIDCVITAYRDHCIFLARGGSLLEVFAELMGRKDGCSKAKGGSMHLYKKENRFYGGHGIVGANIPLGCGLAFGLKYEKMEGVSVTLYGDGTANQGQLYEALNMAALWNLPVVLVCENNHYGMGTAEWRATKSSAYYKRGDYVPGLKVDGMDALAVKQAVKFGKDYALKNGPIILEMDTYRYHGHSMSDPGSTYRTRDEITAFRQERDPIDRVRKVILEKKLASPDDLKGIDKDVRQMVNDAVAQAKGSPPPHDSELSADVYCKGLGTEAFGVDRKQTKTILQ
uniref:Pyruvate dehydrogenase E1 component subunit alpha n=1 Tax=Araucaria cunninghamii TaxID=56994 RepID=A0A0D6QSF2_ARACU